MKIKERTFQIIAWGVCVALAIALIVLVLADRSKMQKMILEAQAQAQLQKDEADAANNEKKSKVQIIFDDLVADLELPEFVCWGDGEMAGIGELSFPNTFEKLLNELLFSDLSDCFNEYIEIETKDIPSFVINDMSIVNEGMNELLARSGVHDLVIGEWALIPEEKKPVNIVFRDNESGTTLLFSEQKAARFGAVEIAEVTGELVVGEGEYDELHRKVAFVREIEGNSVQVGVGTPIKAESMTKYTGDAPLFFFEEDLSNTVNSVEEFVSDLESFVERYTEVDSENEEIPYVVICTAAVDSEVDNSLRDAFGDRYIRNDTYASEMSEEDYVKLAEKVYANLDSQGCFSNVKERIEIANRQLAELKDK